MFDMVYNKILESTIETLYITAISSIGIAIFGLLLGIILFVYSKNQILDNTFIYATVSSIVNVVRAIPFIILIILLLPFTKLIMGTILGPNAVFPGLIIGLSPLYARMVESCFKEVNKGIIEAAKAMGASDLQIIFKVLVPESLPALLSNLTTMVISIVGYTAVAGVIGGGGLGNLAFIEGFQRNNQLITMLATLVILIIVFIVQFAGDFVVKRIDKR